MLNISLNLLSRHDKSNIEKIYSNPAVFGQCRIWLESNLPKTNLIEVSSTTKAAQIVSKEKNSACIASLLAADIYDLKIIAKEIEDSPHNITRFFVIGKFEAEPTRSDKTSIVFSIKDKIGALHDMLLPFKNNDINLTKIESRPSKKRVWEYFFFIDMVGHAKDKNVKKALDVLEEKTKFLKILGSYPVA